MSSILDALRAGTADLHASLEAALPLGTAQLTREGYIRVLQSFHGFLAAWEQQARRSAPQRLEALLQERARTHLLDRDLAALGVADPLAQVPTIPSLHGTAALLGSMYVLEGSRLGGQYLVRRLESHLALTPECGLSFFYGFGPHTGSQWRAFCNVLVEEIAPDQSAAAVQSARATFAAFENWIVDCSATPEACISVAQPML